MNLQPVGLRGRRFTIQFFEIMGEFGHEIPWLDGLEETRYATNPERFRDELMRRTKQGEHLITSYQLVDTDPNRTFLGGILHFPKSPERLTDRRNAEIAERLDYEGASFISCLQVRGVKRGAGVGTIIMKRAMRAILRQHGVVWGVVSNPWLLGWYQSLGAEVLSPLDNTDNLWIIRWKEHV